MNKVWEKFLGVFVAGLCVLLFAVKVTGTGYHVLFGLVLVIVSTAHIYGRRRQLVNRTHSMAIMGSVLTGAFIVLIFSGLTMHALDEIFVIKIVHKLSAVVFFLCFIAHLVQHRTKKIKEKQSYVS